MLDVEVITVRNYENKTMRELPLLRGGQRPGWLSMKIF
jgi:hypothetical protein